MPLLIKDDDFVEISVRYVEKGRQLIFYGEGETAPPDVRVETFCFKYPNWAEQMTMMAGSFTIDATGMPTADPYRYTDAKIKTLLRSWSLKYEDGSPVPVTVANIERMDMELVNYICGKLDRALGLSPLEDAGKDPAAGEEQQDGADGARETEVKEEAEQEGDPA